MNWDAIGAIGEVAGALAVVVTILYLARQTGKNARAVDATSVREVVFRIADWHREAARDPELKRILLKSFSPELEEYTEDQWYEFHLVAVSMFELYQTQFMHGSMDLGNQEESDRYVRIARGLIRFPAWRKWWDQAAAEKTFVSGFVEAIENLDDSADLGFVLSDSRG